MIWLPIYDPITPVHLLQQDHPHQLMRERHLGKTQSVIRPLQHLFSQSDGTSDHECNTALSLYAQRLDLFRQFLRGEHLPADFQCDHIHIVPDIFQDALSFLIPYTVLYNLTRLIRRLFIRHLYDLQLAVTAQPLTVFSDCIFQIFFFDLSYRD